MESLKTAQRGGEQAERACSWVENQTTDWDYVVMTSGFMIKGSISDYHASSAQELVDHGRVEHELGLKYLNENALFPFQFSIGTGGNLKKKNQTFCMP